MWRVSTAFICIVIFYLLIISRLFYWQIIAGEKLSLEAASQHYLELTLPAVRGQILASDGQPLVMNQPAYLIYATPKDISDKANFAKQMSAVLNLESQKLLLQLNEPGKVWVLLAHKVPEALVVKLQQLKLLGLGLEKEPRRFYPEASSSAHLLGFVGADQNGKDRGYFGLEGFYDRELRGKDGRLRLEKDARGVPILVGEAQRIEAENGRNLVLWLDRSVQYFVEKRLQEGIKKYGAKEGSVVVLDPLTGGVLAMAAYPAYDPAGFTEFDNALYKNPIVGDSFEPGSTFKVIVTSGGLNEKAVTVETTFTEGGPLVVGEYTIRTWNDQYHGRINLTQVLQYSSNIGMVQVAQSLGKRKMLEYLRAFGFGETTNIDLEDESSPELRPERDWREIDLATVSFGQGIAVTPMQMVRAVGALANDGWLMKPQVVRGIVDQAGRRFELKPQRLRQVVSSSTAKIMTEMLVNAVEQGEAKWAKPKGYRIAGKTGTAQIPVAGHYDEKKTIASFVGFAPADNPRFVMLVTLREPSSSPWGSETAAPLFFNLARDLFEYWGIPPQS